MGSVCCSLKNLGSGSQGFHFLPPALSPSLPSAVSKSPLPSRGPEGHGTAVHSLQAGLAAIPRPPCCRPQRWSSSALARPGNSCSALGARGEEGWRAFHAGLQPPGQAQALLPRGRLCGECSSTDCRRRTSRSSQSASGSRPFSTARRSDRLLAEGNSR